MAKTSDWKIVATEGTTIDERAISKQWIEDMAKTYSLNEYTAMVWPEHFRSSWAPFDGKNWGFVSEVKAAKFAGKLRLFAKITPNKYLLSANADGQKLFTSIEPKENYAGSGKCYLQGLAVTDSPASTGCEMLKFSIGDKEYSRNVSYLEPLLFSEFNANEEPSFQRFFGAMREFFNTEKLTETNKLKDTEVTEEQLKAALEETLQPFGLRLDAIEQQFTATPAPATQPAESGEATPPVEGDKSETFSAAQFSAVLNEAMKPMVEKLTGLETKFNSLLQEAPGQRNAGEGNADESKVESF